jgi:hypothetical protein
MMKRGRHHLSGCGSQIDGGQVSLRNRNKRRRTTRNNKRTKIKQKRNNEKQTKEREMWKGRDEKQTRLICAWALFRDFFQGLSGRLLRESEELGFITTR